MQKITLMTGLLFTVFGASKLYAIEGKYIKSDINTVSYTTRCQQTESQKKIFQLGFKALSGTSKKFTNSLFPSGKNEDTVLQEMQIATQNRRSLDTDLNFINNWIAEEQTANHSTLGVTEKSYYPRGYLVFYGGALNFGAFKMLGTSMNFALVMVPNCQTVWSKKTGKIIEEDIVDINFELMINPALGAGKKKGISTTQSRFGVGVILDPNHKLSQASDFIGGGVAASRANILGNLAIAGKYIKTGLIMNAKTNYFPFLMIGKAAGVGASQITNWGGVGFMDLSFLSTIFLNLTKTEVEKIKLDTQIKFETSLQAIQGKEKTGENAQGNFGASVEESPKAE